jgi:hypothetical protein
VLLQLGLVVPVGRQLSGRQWRLPIWRRTLLCSTNVRCRGTFSFPQLDPGEFARYPFEVTFPPLIDHLVLLQWNWATIFILGFGNLAAIDFQQRSMAAKTGFGARVANVLAACLCLVIGIPIAYTGSILRYGQHVFSVDQLAHNFLTPECTTVPTRCTQRLRPTRVLDHWACRPVVFGSPNKMHSSSC